MAFFFKIRVIFGVTVKQKRSSISNVDEDSPLGAELLNQIPSDETMTRLTDDGAYDSQVVHEVCYRRRVIPIIPPSEGARLRKDLAFAHRNEAVRHAGDWAGLSGNAGAAITKGHWWRRK